MSRDNEVKLRGAIISLSVSKVWETARCEWKLEEIQITEEPETCLCGHTPINELCFLRNKLNHMKAMVGNVCVHKFMGIPSHLIFEGIKRIMVDINAALNSEATVYAYERGWLTEWEYTFCDDISCWDAPNS